MDETKINLKTWDGVIEALKLIADPNNDERHLMCKIPNFRPMSGLCHNVLRYPMHVQNYERWFIYQFKQWDGYSGIEKYPVPDEEHGARFAYDYYDNLYGDHDYGRARRRLAYFLAEQMERVKGKDNDNKTNIQRA